MSIREYTNTELLRSSVYFSAFCLVFYLYAYPLFGLASRFYGGDELTMAYAANMAGNACGYLAYSCLIRRGMRQKLIILGGVFCLLCFFVVIFFIKSFEVLLVTVFFAATLIGILGAIAHRSLAMLSYGSPISGRVVGFAYAAALAVQFIVVHICASNEPAALAAGLVIAGVAALIFSPPSNWISDDDTIVPSNYSAAPAKSAYAAAIASVAVLTLVYGLYDGVSSNLHAHGKLNVWDYPRLFSIVGILAASWISDIKDRSYMSAAVLCFLTAGTAATLVLRSLATYALSQSLQYLFSGAYVFFFTIVFMDLAPQSKEPALWAGMGRAVHSAVLIPVIFAGHILFGNFGEITIICISMAIFAVSIVLLVVRDRIMAANRETLTKNRSFDLFQTKYALTDRETVIVKMLVENDDTIDTIASELDISKRTCQRDITAIYEKTGTQTRAGLLRVFHED